ncbi:non-hydrolyzing UDP-N-acetylglucosamine 2-epimerase [Luteimonas dalianensis]|uniref:non-hydrolyzing UDP-N-acetylglucosamine 2-epimerase n=1 Tax=Luteimonas dalianensis TaxID=1148196 RepID=UPI003BEF9049
MKPPAPLIDLVIGTRPNIVKAGPLLAALRNVDWCRPRLVFLAQHTQDAMTTDTLEDVGIGVDEVVRVDLEADGTGRRMGEMIDGYARLLADAAPSLVMVFGDVDSTLAAAYAAKRMMIPVAHVEAGLRSGDMAMPEELNRRMVDSISDLLLTTMESANRNLLGEGRDGSDIHFTGNLMIDALRSTLERQDWRPDVEGLWNRHGLGQGRYAVATFHRPSNVDSRNHLEQVTRLLAAASEHLPVVFPVHPRSRAALERHRFNVHGDQVIALPPLRYSSFMGLLSGARLVLTDSGGIQEETSVLGVPCLTFRNNTERPETVTMGTNRLASPADADREIRRILASPMPAESRIPLWDGNAAGRIAGVVRRWLQSSDAARGRG